MKKENQTLFNEIKDIRAENTLLKKNSEVLFKFREKNEKNKDLNTTVINFVFLKLIIK